MTQYTVHEGAFRVDFPNKEQYKTHEDDGITFFDVPDDMCEEFEDSLVLLDEDGR